VAKLTKRTVDAAQAGLKDVFIWDEDVRGFGLKVTPAGRKVFIVQYRTGGRGSPTRRETLGPYGTLTPDEARDMAKARLRKVAEGHDPVAEERAAEAAAADAARRAEDEARLAHDLRFDRLADRWLNEHVAVKRKPKTRVGYKILLEKHAFPKLAEKDARSITRQDVDAIHRALADHPAVGNRVVATISAVYGWADRMEMLPNGTRNPAAKIEKYKEKGREKYLTVEELARLGAAIRQGETQGLPWEPKPGAKAKHAPRPENRLVRIDPIAAAALRLLIFTGARLREILCLEWTAVDLERGLLRLRDSKTGPKVIVLNAPARAVLAGLTNRNERYVLPGDAVDDEGNQKPRSDLKGPWRAVTRAAKLEGLRIHDLRHSFASVGASGGLGLPVVGALLGHASTQTTQRYAHLDSDPLREASDKIATRIAAAMGEAPAEPSAEVIPLKRS